MIFNTALDGLLLYPRDRLGLESEARKEKMLKVVCCIDDENSEGQNINFKMIEIIFKLTTPESVFRQNN